MSRPGFAQLQDVLLDDDFPELDLSLRRGRHIDRDDVEWFGFLADAADVLEPFYQRFDAELVFRTDGYYYLLPTGEKLAKRHLSVAEMLVGQALTLLYLEPACVAQGGRVTREEVLGHLATVMGTDALVRAMNPKRRRYDERVAQETVRARVADALRRLATLGFVDTLGAEELKLRPALLRFAEPVRASADSNEALARLVASGELSLTPLDSMAPDGVEQHDAAESGDEPAEQDELAEHDEGALEDSADAAAEPPEPPADLLDDFAFEDVER